MMRREDTRLLGCAGSGAVLATAWGGVALLLDWLGRQPPDVLARLRGAVLLLLGIGLVYVGVAGGAR